MQQAQAHQPHDAGQGGAAEHAGQRQCLPGLAQRWTPVGCTVAFTLVVVVCSWLLALVSYHAFERWFLALKRFFPSSG